MIVWVDGLRAPHPSPSPSLPSASVAPPGDVARVRAKGGGPYLRRPSDVDGAGRRRGPFIAAADQGCLASGLSRGKIQSGFGSTKGVGNNPLGLQPISASKRIPTVPSASSNPICFSSPKFCQTRAEGDTHMFWVTFFLSSFHCVYMDRTVVCRGPPRQIKKKGGRADTKQR